VARAMVKKQKASQMMGGVPAKRKVGPSRAALEERQARALAAMQGQVEAMTTSRQGRKHMTALKSYFA